MGFTLEIYNNFLIVMSAIAVVVFVALQFFEAGYGYLFDRRYGPPVPNKIGWVLMESPVFIAMCVLWAISDRQWDVVPLVLFGVFQLHYFQRSFIFPLLMRGNSKMPLGIVLMGMIFNTLNALMQGGWIFFLAPENYYADWFAKPFIYIGIVVFFAGMFIMPISALCMASGNMLDPSQTILTMHPVAFMMVVGIVFQGLAETFISPRFLEYFSLQAPKGEEGLYLGFSHLHSFLSSIFGFGISGFLLSKYCPEPALFASHEEWLAASANAHYIWYYFGAIALVSAFALIIYGRVVKYLDSKKQQ